MIFKLTGKIRHYDWGGELFIPRFLQLKPESGKPFAEYWLGAHDSAPSEIEFAHRRFGLDRFIAEHPEVLGDKCLKRFGGTLPYLLKVLDVKQPLSIQVHPSKAEAEAGFAAENRLGIALNAANRNYKDQNHKPEMMIALSDDFWLLHGFRNAEAIQADLAKYASLQGLGERIKQKGVAAVYADIMQADKALLTAWLKPVIEVKLADYEAGGLTPDQPEYWVCYLFEQAVGSADKIDAGWLSFYLLNIVHLKKGEGIYQGANLPHAYLRGQNIELMANSDNVIRGGLTPKYIDVATLLQLLDYRAVNPQIIPAYTAADGSFHRYPTPEAEDFALQRIAFAAGKPQTFRPASAAILLVMEGGLDLPKQSISLGRGEAVFIAAGGEADIIGKNDGYAFIASLPE